MIDMGSAPTHGWPQRHIDIVSLVACGFSNAAISERLHIEVNTVKSHLTNMRKRNMARNRAHLVFIAMRQGVIR